MDLLTDETRFAVNDLTNWRALIITLNVFFVARIIYKGSFTLSAFVDFPLEFASAVYYGISLLIHYIISESVISAALLISITKIIISSSKSNYQSLKVAFKSLI